MPKVRNITTGPRGAYLKGVFVEAAPGAVIEADDFAPEWFEQAGGKPDPLDHDGDGKPGGSPTGENATRVRGRAKG